MLRIFLAPFSLGIALFFAMPAGAAGKSLGFAYGPTDQVRFSLDWQRWGIYAQPVLSWQDSDNSRYSRLEAGGRGGAYFAYTAFTFRAMECRLLGGAGSHFVMRTVTYKEENVEIQSRQQAVEAWMQPEFRFFDRFSVLLQAQVLRYVMEGSLTETEDEHAGFELPDLSLSSLRIGLKYYLPFGRQ